MNQNKVMETCASWATIGGFVGFALTFLLFGFGGSSGATGILIGAMKGFVGGGLGAAIFYCLAGTLFSPKIGAKLGYLTTVVVLSLVALFLANKFSSKFNNLVGNSSDPSVVDTMPIKETAPVKPRPPKEIYVLVSTNMILSTGSVIGMGENEELISAVKKLSDQDPDFEVVVSSVYEENVVKAIELLQSAGVNNVRAITNEDYLRFEREEQERRNKL